VVPDDITETAIFTFLNPVWSSRMINTMDSIKKTLISYEEALNQNEIVNQNMEKYQEANEIWNNRSNRIEIELMNNDIKDIILLK